MSLPESYTGVLLGSVVVSLVVNLATLLGPVIKLHSRLDLLGYRMDLTERRLRRLCELSDKDVDRS